MKTIWSHLKVELNCYRKSVYPFPLLWNIMAKCFWKTISNVKYVIRGLSQMSKVKILLYGEI